MTDLNKLQARRFFDEVCGAGRFELLGELIADDYLGNDPLRGGPDLSRDGLRAMLARYLPKVPGLAFHIIDQVAEDDRVATRWRSNGGPVCVHGITMMRFLAGRQVESWTCLAPPSARIHQPLNTLQSQKPHTTPKAVEVNDE